jgi:hypothetical protein
VGSSAPARSLILALAIAIPAVASAHCLVVKAGVSFGKLRLLPDKPPVTALPAFSGGVAVQPQVSFLPGLQVEALYTRRGVRTTGPLEIQIDYIAVPILERIKIPLPFPGKLHGFIGPEIAFRMGAGLQPGSVDFSDFIKRRGISLVAGLDVEIKRLVLDVRYAYGTSNIAADPAKLGDNYKSRAFVAMAGWRFR